MDLNKAERHIRNAVRLGYFLFAFYGIHMVSLFYGDIYRPHPYYAVISLIILFLLIYGTSRKSRISVILLFVYYLHDRLGALVVYIMYYANYGLSYFSFKHVIMVIIAIIVVYYLLQGVRGTFVYHKIMSEGKLENTDIKNTQ